MSVLPPSWPLPGGSCMLKAALKCPGGNWYVYFIYYLQIFCMIKILFVCMVQLSECFADLILFRFQFSKLKILKLKIFN